MEDYQRLPEDCDITGTIRLLWFAISIAINCRSRAGWAEFAVNCKPREILSRVRLSGQKNPSETHRHYTERTPEGLDSIYLEYCHFFERILSDGSASPANLRMSEICLEDDLRHSSGTRFATCTAPPIAQSEPSTRRCRWGSST